MNIVYGVVLFILLLVLAEVISILLKITGLDLEKARFQVVSVITHTGFTTRESELIAQHSTRRKIMSYLMLVSYVGQATLFSLFFSILKEHKGIINLILLILCILVLILFFTTSKRFLSILEPALERYFASQMKRFKERKSIEEILYLNEDFEVMELVIKESSRLCNICLKDLKDEYIKILIIDKGSHIISFPRGTDLLEVGDRVVVYGKIDILSELERENRRFVDDVK